MGGQEFEEMVIIMLLNPPSEELQMPLTLQYTQVRAQFVHILSLGSLWVTK